MIRLLGDCIVSPLGFSSRENFHAIKSGQSSIREEDGAVSRLDRSLLSRNFKSTGALPGDYTPLEQAMIHAAFNAIKQSGIDASCPRTIFIISTTKGNVELLGEPGHQYGPERIYLWHTARLVSGFFNNPNKPFVISNACISGSCAQITARRLLESSLYDYAVVVGGDMLSEFIVSGFRSFQSLSPVRCRPFDAGRKGLNLGEAGAAMVYGRESHPVPGLYLSAGAIRNDANHISGPSRTGEGLYLALEEVLEHTDRNSLAFINAHGTATLYNDQMEAVALSRSGLSAVPVNSLKAYLGHTLGAAGVAESIISLMALDEGIVLPSLGYETNGVTETINVIKQCMPANGNRFLKMLSGFGGCNAVLLFEKTV